MDKVPSLDDLLKSRMIASRKASNGGTSTKKAPIATETMTWRIEKGSSCSISL